MSHPFSVSSDFDLGTRNGVGLVASAADVVIREGNVPETIEATYTGATFQLREGEFLLNVPNGTRIYVKDGREIIYSRGPGVGDRDVSLFILGSAWGALCYQRGLLPIHCSAVIVDGKIVAFTGRSGSGKSTMAANLALRGAPFFTDDTLIFDPALDSESAVCHSGQKQLKLWGDAIKRTGAKSLHPIRDQVEMDKHFAVPANASDLSIAVLDKLIVLSRARGKIEQDNALKRLKGSEALLAIKANLYRPNYAETLMGRKPLFLALKRLSETVEVSRFTSLRTDENYNAGFEFIADAIGLDGRGDGDGSG